MFGLSAIKGFLGRWALQGAVLLCLVLLGTSYWLYGEVQETAEEKARVQETLAQTEAELQASREVAERRRREVEDLSDVLAERAAREREARVAIDTLKNRLEGLGHGEANESGACGVLGATVGGDVRELVRDAAARAAGGDPDGADPAGEASDR